MNEIDRIRETYAGYDQTGRSTRWSGDHAIHEERSRLVRELIDGLKQPGAPMRVLDLGCGRGNLADDLMAAGVGRHDIVGVDLIPDRVVEANRRGLLVSLASGDALPFVGGSFDVVTAFTVFSSIHDPHVLAGIRAEVERVLRPNGALIVYDMRLPNPFNRSVHPINSRTLDRLFSGWDRTSRSCTLIPQVARRFASEPGGRYRTLAAVPLLRSHLLSVLRPPTTVTTWGEHVRHP